MNMLLLAGVVVVVVLVVCGVSIWLIREKGLGADAGAASSAYYLRKSVLTPAERSFLGVLDTALQDDYRICVKMRLADIFGVKSGGEGGARRSAMNRINAKHVDFLLVRASDGAAVLGIELDDASHERADRRERDAFVDGVFAAAALPIEHVRAQAQYSVADVRALLAKHF